MSKFKVGDKVRIKTLTHPSKGKLSGVIGHEGIITDINSSGWINLTPSCIGMTWTEDYLELVDQPKEDLTGRWIKALVHNPENCGLSIDTYAKIERYADDGCAKLVNCLWITISKIGTLYELMPIGFEPNVKDSKKDLLAEAKRRYIVGVKFLSSDDNNKIRTINCYHGETELRWFIDIYGKVRCQNGMSSPEGGCSNPSIYCNGRWAEIIADEVVPAYVECLVGCTGQFTKGKIYRTTKESTKTGYCVESDDVGERNGLSSGHFTPSTREAYEKQNRITPKQEAKVEVFPGIFVGDIVVSLSDVESRRKIGDLFVVRQESRVNRLYYVENQNSSTAKHWRKATPYEESWFNKWGIKNVGEIAIRDLEVEWEATISWKQPSQQVQTQDTRFPEAIIVTKNKKKTFNIII